MVVSNGYLKAFGRLIVLLALLFVSDLKDGGSDQEVAVLWLQL